jgi:hypothetical protein
MGTSAAAGTYYRGAITIAKIAGIAKIAEIGAVWKMQVADNKY